MNKYSKGLKRMNDSLDRIFDFGSLHDMIDNVERNFFTTWESTNITEIINPLITGSNFPKINVVDNGESYEVEVAAAGFNKEHIDLELKNNSLIVKVDKKEEKTSDEKKKFLMREITQRSFTRVVPFPHKIDREKISSSFKDGMVTITLGKEMKNDTKSNTLKIEIE